MKLTSLAVTNFLGISEASIVPRAPVLFFAGSNGAGKSSLAEAIRHTLTGESVRVDLKKEYPGLLHDGAKSGTVSIEWEGGEAALVLPSGDRNGSGSIPDATPFLLDAPRFAAIEPKERRAFLFGLMGVKASKDNVKKRLLARGCDPTLSDAALPYLAAGFESAQKEAQGKAREAKGAWRTLTGETYGEKKAEGWAAEVPNASGIDVAKAEADVAKLDEAIEAANREVGKLEAEAQASAGRAKELATLREKAGMIPRIKAKLDVDTQEEKRLRYVIEQAKIHKAGQHYACPECAAALVLVDGVLAKFEREPGDDTGAEAADDLEKYEKALALMESAVRNGNRDLATAEAAAERVKELEAAPSSAEVEAKYAAEKEKLDQIKDERRGAHADLLKAREASRAVAEAETKTAQAGELHRAVLAWDAIADAFSPDGIPAELLAEAIGPFNARLTQNAEEAQWPVPQIDGDMNITVGGRLYRFRSESEKWRTDALIAATIAHFSGAKFFLLDRFDVLDASGRSDALYWLDGLAVSGAIESAVVLGTLKSPPSGLPETIDARWIEAGRVSQPMRAAA